MGTVPSRFGARSKMFHYSVVYSISCYIGVFSKNVYGALVLFRRTLWRPSEISARGASFLPTARPRRSCRHEILASPLPAIPSVSADHRSSAVESVKVVQFQYVKTARRTVVTIRAASDDLPTDRVSLYWRDETVIDENNLKYQVTYAAISSNILP